MRKRERRALTFGVSVALVAGGAFALLTHLPWLALLGILVGAMLGVLFYFVY